MPIIWRYLLGSYIKVLLLCVVSFIAILLVTRLDEIAQFAALGGQGSFVALFTLYQIPFILPIAIPVSALISAILLFQKLSHSHELTALRASGFSLTMICFPILIAGVLFTLLNFYITSELSTESRLLSRKMIHEITSVNPIVLLQNAKIAKLKGAYIQMETLQSGEVAKDIIIAVNNHASGRLNLFVAKDMEVKDRILKSKDISFISSIANAAPDYDHLVIENQKSAYIEAPEFAHILRKSSCRVPNDHLKLSFLQLRLTDLKERYHESKDSEIIDKHLERSITRCYSDIVRRICLGLAPLSFTLMGMAFGMEISRHSSRKGLISVVILGAISLVSFFIAKELDHKLLLSSILYILPHITIFACALRTINCINRGME